AWNERHRTDWFPELAQLFQGQVRFDALLHMLRRDAFPDHVGKVSGDMIEDAHVEERLMREREKRRARSDACSEDPNSFDALLAHPPYRRACVEHGLPHRLNRAADV